MTDKSVLRVSDDLKLPAEDFLESAVAIVGKRGRGKSGLVKVLMEELVKVGLPFVAFDPVGVMWGLRSSLDGSGPGLPVLVVGGAHGDLRLERRAGAEIARAVVQANVSCVVDFSEESKGVYREFVRDFAHELFRINDTPRIVIVEEAPELVPQRIRPDMGDVFEAVERLVSRGRNKGLGVVLVSQRAATINKDVLTQVDALFIFGLVSPQDRKAIEEWVEAHDEKGKLAQFMDGIAALERQECWFWSPEAFGAAFKKLRVRDFTTFHPDKTHLRRSGLLKAKAVTTDVSEIVRRLGAQMDRLAKVKDQAKEIPRLQAEVRKLRQQRDELVEIAAKSKERVQDPKAVERAVREAVLPLKRENAELRQELGHLKRAVSSVRVALDRIDLDKEFVKRIQRSMPEPVPSPRRQIALLDIEPLGPAPLEGDVRLTKAHYKILAAIAQLHGIGVAKPSKTQAALWAGYSPTSGGYYNYLGQLRAAGLIDYGGDATLFLTDRGRATKADVEVPSTVEDLQEQVFRMVGESKTKILKVAIEEYPSPIAKPELAERAGFSPTSGGYYNYLGTLRSMGLIDYTDGKVVATRVLFLEAD